MTIGGGVLSSLFTTLTGEDVPSAPPNVTARNTSSTSILLEWDVIPEDDRNGVLLGYVVYYNNTDGTEAAFIHRSTSISVDVTGLEKFTIYHYEVTAFTSIGEGNRSTIVYCRTDQDVPSAPPQDITGIPSSPSKMGILWKPVPYQFHDGIVLGYRFVFSNMYGGVLVSKTLPPDQTMIAVGDLDIFTNYTVNMTAFTSKGDGPWGSKVVLSLQIAPDIAPANLSGVSYTTLSSIPISWIKVPPEKTKGYILGYKLHIKLHSIGLEEVPNAKEYIIELKGVHHSSYTFEGLDFFSQYKIYVVAFTVAGDSPISNVIYPETCRCSPILSTQWKNLAPYTNISNPDSPDPTTLKESWGIFPYIVNDAVQFCCKSCLSHNRSTVDYSHNVHGEPSEVFSDEQLISSIDGLTDLTFPVYGYIDMEMYHQEYKYTALVESPGSAFIVRKEQSSMSGVLFNNIVGNWGIVVLMICMAMAAGAIMWILERGANPEEFPPTVFKGVGNGFWWAYISMTTVGYGDKTPQTILGRIFAMIWTLTGLVITGIMVGNLASALTVSVSDVETMIYGTKIGALLLSADYRLGIRMNAKLDMEISYENLDELQKGLLIGEVDGILLDGYVVGSRKDLFDIPSLKINRIKDYSAAYGIVWSGRTARLKVCLNWYMAGRKKLMFNHVVDNLVFAKPIETIDASDEMANLFDPTTDIYTKSLFLSLSMLGGCFVFGIIYEIIRRRRLALKIKPQGINNVEEKRIEMNGMKLFLQQSFTNLSNDIKTLKYRHIKQVKKFIPKNSK